ncbi:helix-turn-helix domain-containing protein [Nocardiopsis sp. NRRL B-16309]|uniref:helix-turn-helix domain-containing protein n=1 Tax=Nocardiopsis sp. NRRL B-16309 TaxID=1519494 RepID=UPI000A8FD9A9|nr:helix-turn-helix transcriptional regulator [Nocardiopsis sp. NRRL B-16309]
MTANQADRPYTDLGALVGSYRIKQGLTISAVAARALCAESAVLRLENGYLMPTGELLGRISGALGLSPDEAAELREASRRLAPDRP